MQTIQPNSPLSPVTSEVTIDGYTQPGSSANTATTGTDAVLRIELDGSNAGPNADGLTLRGSNSLVRGLVVNRFSGTGIVVDFGFSTPSGVSVASCFVGTNPAGTADRGNANFSFPPIPSGRSVTLTATRDDGQTSEFSAAVPVKAS